MLNLTMFKKATPKKKLQLQNQQKFEKKIDEEVFSDDEDDYDQVNCSYSPKFDEQPSKEKING